MPIVAGVVIETQVVAEIRATYREIPSCTAAGLAKLYRLPLDAVVTVLSTGHGADGNLIAYRINHLQEIARKIGENGRVRPEPAMLRRTVGGSGAPRERLIGASASAARSAYWTRRRAAEAAAAATPSEHLIGASMVAAQRRRRAAEAAAKVSSATANRAAPNEPTGATE